MHIGSPGWLEIVLIAAVIILLFGARRLPDLARSLGRSLSEFKKGRAEGKKEEAAENKKEDEESRQERRG